MKYLVAWAWEMDGHAGAAAMVCDSRQAVKDYIDQCLKDDEGNPMGQITSSNLTDTGSFVRISAILTASGGIVNIGYGHFCDKRRI